ncbi:hypothetical protein [Inquilinus sp.]|uniref:hypothetical protein n=1 Tax=Inquilinus sp. TaxID=1932117 RepID=UPI0031DD7BB5
MSEVGRVLDVVGDEVTLLTGSTEGAPPCISLGALSVCSSKVGAPGIAASSGEVAAVVVSAVAAVVGAATVERMMLVRSLPALGSEAAGLASTRAAMPSVARRRAAGASAADGLSTAGDSSPDVWLVSTGDVGVGEREALPAVRWMPDGSFGASAGASGNAV